MTDAIKNMMVRRSVRSYKSDPVARELLMQIADAGLWAPTGMNRQDVRFVIVTDPDVLSAVSKMNAAVMGNTGDPFYGAPAAIIVFADSQVHTYVEDGSLAMGNMLNAAASLGLGSCWIHRAREVFDSRDGRALCRSWGIPDSYVGIGNCVVGYSDGQAPEAKPRLDGRITEI